METKNWIGGEWMKPNGGEVIIHNPSNLEEEVGVLYCSTEDDVRQAGEAAKRAAKSWGRLSGSARGELLYTIADTLQHQLEEVATLASREMGKPITEMKMEVMRGVQLLRYYAGEGVRTNGSIIPSAQPDTLQYSKRVPLGVVGLITPWNFPVAIPIWKLAPALICGNTVIWKPAEYASLTATKLAQIFAEAGLPDGVLNLVIGKGRVIGNILVEELEIDAISFTGSTAVGKQIAAKCAKRNIKYQTEMGGKNAAIVCRDANLDETVPILLSGAFRSAGQKCTATSRVIVDKAIWEPFLWAIRKGMSSVKLSNALDPQAYLGPVASKDQYHTVQSFVDLARKDAEIVVEGTINQKEDGYYIPPIVVKGVDANHTLVQDEIFGPFISLLPAENFEEAIDLCNRSIYGLSASIFTQNLNHAFRFLEEAEAGMVRVNQETAGVEYQAPFGGMKMSSSHTREQGTAALDFYTQIKTCAIRY
ncbi:aldehyde dehydrogenase family protein [Shimazuella kribbensis]|uniref:aldehyde dehydrogenase family protein n=1 Tax=Shimazuella kribbensis TaxID=139808 RepID=UPI00041487F4|nr:aldehyde dehydrogenase family protein [Shimazuella kribbensis]